MNTEKLARSLLDRSDVYILDLETTGLLDKDPGTEAVQITLMNTKGKIVFSSLINPGRKIPPAAIAVHGILDSDVVAAPSLPEVLPFLERYLDGSTLLAYNAGFDVHLLTHLLRKYEVADKFFLQEVKCVMEMYQAWSGSRKCLPLPNLSGLTKHDASVDCLNTLLLLQKMAGEDKEKEVIDLDF